jgi:hypothetical protein
MTSEMTRLANELRAAADAHHICETNGTCLDITWPDWYARYIIEHRLPYHFHADHIAE